MPETIREPDREPVFDTRHLPSDPSTWPQFRKVALTRALRVQGPFTVETSEGPLRCEDGYLCMDSRGYPYPVALDEFQSIYVPAEDPPLASPAVDAVERPDLPYRCPDCVTTGASTCPHPRPTIRDVERGARESKAMGRG